MKLICIQLETGSDGIFHRGFVKSELERIGIVFDIQESMEESGPSANFYFESHDVEADFIRLRASILACAEVANTCDVICQGKTGWDDLYFLHTGTM